MYQHWSHFQNTIRYLVKTRYWYWKFNVKWWTTVCADINKQVYRVTWRPSETSHCILCWYRLFKRCKSVDESQKSHMCCTEVNKLYFCVCRVSLSECFLSLPVLFCSDLATSSFEAFISAQKDCEIKPANEHSKKSTLCVLRSNQQRRNVHIKSRRTGSYMYYYKSCTLSCI